MFYMSVWIVFHFSLQARPIHQWKWWTEGTDPAKRSKVKYIEKPMNLIKTHYSGKYKNNGKNKQKTPTKIKGSMTF